MVGDRDENHTTLVAILAKPPVLLDRALQPPRIFKAITFLFTIRLCVSSITAAATASALRGGATSRGGLICTNPRLGVHVAAGSLNLLLPRDSELPTVLSLVEIDSLLWPGGSPYAI